MPIVQSNTDEEFANEVAIAADAQAAVEVQPEPEEVLGETGPQNKMAELEETLKSQDFCKLKKSMEKAIKKLTEFESKRSANNAEMAAIRAAMETQGIPKRATNLALQLCKLEEPEIALVFFATSKYLEAMGKPTQVDWIKEVK